MSSLSKLAKSSSSRLKELVETSRTVRSETQTDNLSIQPIHRDPEQLFRSASKLAKNAPRPTESQRIKGTQLLSRSDCDLSKIERVSKLDLKSTFEPMEPISDTDIPTFLRHKHEEILLTAIEEVNKVTFNDFSDQFVQTMEDEWMEYKNGLMQATTDLHAQRRQGNVQLSRFSTSSIMDLKMRNYARAVGKFNDNLENRFPLISELRQEAQLINESDVKKQTVSDCWSLLERYFPESMLLKRQPQPFDDSVARVDAAIDFLETQMKAHIMSRGGYEYKEGRKLMVQHVQMFLELVLQSDDKRWPDILSEFDINDELPFWPKMYYFLRCGELEEPCEMLRRQGQSMHKELLKQLEALHTQGWKSGVLRHQQGALHNEHTASRSEDEDPYRGAVYGLLLNKPELVNEVVNTLQDFLWLELKGVQALAHKPDQYALELQRMQEMLVEEYGAEYFCPDGQNPMLYFQVLLLTQQFELAVDYLVAHEPVEATHFALAMHAYNGINVYEGEDPRPGELLVVDEANGAMLNLVQLVQAYVHPFAHQDVDQAAQYYNFLSDDIKTECFLRLVLDTRDYDRLLGSVDGYEAGVLSHFLSQDQLSFLVEQCARTMEENSEYADAMMLYDRLPNTGANERHVLAILSNLLSRDLIEQRNSKSGASSMNILEYAREKESQNQNQWMEDDEVVKEFRLMLKLATFTESFYQDEFRECLRIIRDTELLPTRPEMLDESVNEFAMLNDTIKRHLGQILLHTMESIKAEVDTLRSGRSGHDGRRTLRDYEEWASTLLQYSVQVKYNFGDIGQRINELETRIRTMYA